MYTPSTHMVLAQPSRLLFIHATLMVLALVSIARSNVVFAQANDKAIRIAIDTDIEPATSVGFLLSQDGMIKKLEASAKRKDRRVIVAFPYSSHEIAEGTMATAMITGADGSIAFGEVIPVSMSEGGSALATLPDCKLSTKFKLGAQGHLALVESLLSIRTERKKVQQKALESELQGDLLNRLKKLEQGFGLEGSHELSPQLTPLEICDRLYRIKVAIENTRLSKERER